MKAVDEIWMLSAALNERRRDHPISPSTLAGIAKRGDTTCQHALFIQRWLGRTPESFFPSPSPTEGDFALPSVGSDRRLRWDLQAVYEALDARRRERELTWKEVAKELRCTDHHLRGIKVARYAIGMKLMMAIVQWVERPAAAFISAAKW